MLLFSRILNEFLIFGTFKTINLLMFTNFEFLLYTNCMICPRSGSLSENQSYFKYERINSFKFLKYQKNRLVFLNLRACF